MIKNILIYGLIFSLLILPSLSFSAGYSMQIHPIKLSDLVRIVYGDALRKNFVIDDDLLNSNDSVSINLSNASSKQSEKLLIEILETRGFEVQEIGNIVFIRKRKKEDDGFTIYYPRFRSAKYLSDIVSKVLDVKQLGARSMQATQNQQQAIKTQPEVSGAASTQFERTAPDQLAYECSLDQCKRINKFLSQIDTPETQVILRAVLYEVGTLKGEGSALQVASNLLFTNAGNLTMTSGSVLPASNRFNFAGANIDTVVSVLDNDARFKSVSRPMLRVKTGAQAKFSVGQQVPVLGAITMDKNGNPIQSVDYRQSGTIFTVQPDIRKDVVNLILTQELSNFVVTTTGVNNSPTLLQRTVNSELSITDGEVVVFAGLEEEKHDEAKNYLFGLPIGKKNNESTSELLLFIEATRI